MLLRPFSAFLMFSDVLLDSCSALAFAILANPKTTSVKMFGWLKKLEFAMWNTDFWRRIQVDYAPAISSPTLSKAPQLKPDF